MREPSIGKAEKKGIRGVDTEEVGRSPGLFASKRAERVGRKRRVAGMGGGSVGEPDDMDRVAGQTFLEKQAAATQGLVVRMRGDDKHGRGVGNQRPGAKPEQPDKKAAADRLHAWDCNAPDTSPIRRSRSSSQL